MRATLYSFTTALLMVSCLVIPFATAQEISTHDVDLRIETFDEIDKLFKALRFKIVNQRSTNHQAALKYSSQLVELAYRLPDLFDVPSAADAFPQSRSRPEIWSRKAFFDTQMFNFVDNLEDINDEVKAGNLTKAGQLIDETAKGCRRCHNAFRYK